MLTTPLNKSSRKSTSQKRILVPLPLNSDYSEKKQRMFGILAIIDILHCRELHTNLTLCGQFFSVHGPFQSDLRPW